MLRFGKNIAITWLTLTVWAIAFNLEKVRRMEQSIPNDKIILAIGDSHSTGFTDPNLLNLSIPGEPFPIQASKALIALENRDFHTLLCTIGPQTASSEPLRLLNDERNWLSGSQSKINLILWSQPQTLSLLNFKTILHSALCSFHLTKQTTFRNGHNDHGLATDLSKQKTTSRLRQHDILKEDWYCDGKRLNGALTRLAEKCRKTGTNMVIIETPYHHTYRTQIQPDDYAKFKSDITTFCSSRDHVSFSDFSNTDYPDDHFRDADHLNQRGFQRFMREEFQSLLH